MWHRCTNTEAKAYKNYGGRGIRVCSRWERYENFLKDMGRRPGTGFSLERVDNDGHYSPKNCEWATKAKQTRNRRCSRRLTAFGTTKTYTEWCEEFGVKYTTLISRIDLRGWSPEKALTEPARGSKS